MPPDKASNLLIDNLFTGFQLSACTKNVHSYILALFKTEAFFDVMIS